MSDCHDFTELSTEHIYALSLDSLNKNPHMFLDPCLECLPRVVDNAMHVPFVRVSPTKSFLV